MLLALCKNIIILHYKFNLYWPNFSKWAILLLALSNRFIYVPLLPLLLSLLFDLFAPYSDLLGDRLRLLCLSLLPDLLPRLSLKSRLSFTSCLSLESRLSLSSLYFSLYLSSLSSLYLSLFLGFSSLSFCGLQSSPYLLYLSLSRYLSSLELWYEFRGSRSREGGFWSYSFDCRPFFVVFPVGEWRSSSELSDSCWEIGVSYLAQ